jgi:MoxR-like ATPase
VRPIKAGRELVEFVKLCYAARRPPLLIGRHGVGKSQILEQAACEMGIGFLCRDLSIMEPPDLVGMPKLDGRATRYLPPAFLPTDGQGLLVFEELNRCPSYMRAPCLQLLTARTLNDYTLPDGWLPAAAINPDDADYDTQGLDPALLSRFTRADVVADPKAWLLWAQRAGVHEDVIEYVQHDELVFNGGGDSNPRAWKAVSDLLLVSDGVSRSTLEAAFSGTVGAERAIAFSDFRKHGAETVPQADELLAKYDNHRRRVQAYAQQGRTDTLSQIVHSMMVFLQPMESYARVRGDRTEWKNFGRLLDDLPADLAEQVRTFLRERDRDVPKRRMP